MNNPFFERETAQMLAQELPTLPILSTGYPAQMQAAFNLSDSLYQVGYVGSEESVEHAVEVFAPMQAAFRDLSIELQDRDFVQEFNRPEDDPLTGRELVIGAAAIYGFGTSQGY